MKNGLILLGAVYFIIILNYVSVHKFECCLDMFSFYEFILQLSDAFHVHPNPAGKRGVWYDANQRFCGSFGVRR